MRFVPSLVATALCAFCSLAGAAPIRQPLVAPGDASERQLLDDAADGQFAAIEPLDAALIASGVPDSEARDTYHRRFAEIAERVQAEAAAAVAPRQRAAAILAVLERDVLTGPFDAGCGSVALTLDKGRYNCVTATILFLELSHRIDLPVTPLHAPGHVRVRVDANPPFELEPTCAACLAEAQLLGWQSPPRALTYPALLGKLYYNQGVAALEQRDFAAATAAFDRSLLLDPLDAQAKQNLLAALNNGALALCEDRQFTAAQAMLRSAAHIDPHYPPLAANDLHLLGRWVIGLCETSQHAEALALLEQAAARHPQAELCRTGPAAIYRLWAEDLLRRGESHAALARVEAGLKRYPNDTRLQRLHAQLAP